MSCHIIPATTPVDATLEALVADFLAKRKETPRDDVTCYRTAGSLSAALMLAAHAKRNDEKRHSHQWRITPETIRQTEPALLAAEPQLAAAKNFDEVHSIVARICKRIRGAGVLYIYDTALRIGHYRNLAPTKVYLHCGTRDGAEHLGLGRNRATLDMSQLPAALRVLTAIEIEDFLCLYKDQLRAMRKGSPITVSTQPLRC